MYPQYQSAAWVAGLGPNYLVNGAHDIFMNVLADQGFIGLLLFLALLVYIGLRSVGAWRRLRSLERDEGLVDTVREQAQRHRLTVAVATASMVAYIVQAVFNVQQVGLSFSFWLLIGCSTVIAQAVGVPDTLRPKSLVAASPTADNLVEAEVPGYQAGQPGAGLGAPVSQPAQAPELWAPPGQRALVDAGGRGGGGGGNCVPRPGGRRPISGGPRLLGRVHQPETARAWFVGRSQRGEQTHPGGRGLLRRPQACVCPQPLGTELPGQ